MRGIQGKQHLHHVWRYCAVPGSDGDLKCSSEPPIADNEDSEAKDRGAGARSNTLP